MSDHTALSAATQHAESVAIVFIFDSHIIKQLENKSDQRVSLIYDSLLSMAQKISANNGALFCLFGEPEKLIPKMIKEHNIDALYFNRDYDPYAKKRDEKVSRFVEEVGAKVYTFRDHVIFEGVELANGQGQAYRVFTAYKNRWFDIFSSQEQQRIIEQKVDLKKLSRNFDCPPFPNQNNLFKAIGLKYVLPTLAGGEESAQKILKVFSKKITQYKNTRDMINEDGTSMLSPHLRHGTISIRHCFRLAFSDQSLGHKVWASELIWREFYQMILDQFPHVAKSSFKAEYDQIKWLGGKKEFSAWCKGETGFPIIDAAMRCLNQTGIMHNRARMIVASFLCKTLLCDWRWGEEYFAQKLLDFDLAANSGGWQWCSSSGCDAQPYFRIFNPYTQSLKFDPSGGLIRKWIPELSFLDDNNIHRPELELREHKRKMLKASHYPRPIVDYEMSRIKAVKMYQIVKSKIPK